MIYIALSSDGNVGKTTLARFVLKPHFPASRLVEVEQVGVEDSNAQRTLVIRDAAEGGRPALTAVLLASLQGNLIVDVGASLCDSVIDLLADAHARLAETPLTIVTPVVLSGADNRKSLAHLAKIAGALDALELKEAPPRAGRQQGHPFRCGDRRVQGSRAGPGITDSAFARPWCRMPPCSAAAPRTATT